ncbi:MAG: hypothetical protein OHK0022_45940 [Roseiflexaceae bacterium]
MTDAEIQQLYRQLTLARQALAGLLGHVAATGGAATAPLALRDALDQQRLTVAGLKATLRAHGAVVDDLPGEQGPAAGPMTGVTNIFNQQSGNQGTFYGPITQTFHVPTPSAQPIQTDRAQMRLCDVLFVTVTDVETRSVFGAFQAHTGNSPQTRYLDDKTYYDLGKAGAAQVWLVRSEMGSGTPGGAQATMHHAINTLRPAAVMMVGIAFGLQPHQQQLGDVLVARQLMLYDLQRISTAPDGSLVAQPRGDRATVSLRLLDRCRDAALRWRPVGQEPPPEVRFGLLLSGDKLVDHGGLVRQLLAFEPEAIGGEMEGAGLYVAAQQHKVDWILIKAICDWADGHKGDAKQQRQEQAARNAALFALHVLAQGGLAAPTAAG